MFVMTQKLKTLKAAFKSWNKEVFGDVHNLVETTQSALDFVQNQIEVEGLNDELSVKELAA